MNILLVLLNFALILIFIYFLMIYIKKTKKLKIIFDGLPYRAALLDNLGRIVSTNQYWDQFARSTFRKLGVGINYLDCCEKDGGNNAWYARKIANGIREALMGTRQDFAIKYPEPVDGKDNWYQCRGRALILENRVHVLVSHEDVTYFVESENRVMESRNKLAKIFDSSPNILIVVDETGSIVEYNNALCTRFCISNEEAIEKKINDLFEGFEEKEIDFYRDEFTEEISWGNQSEQFKINGLRRDGTKFPVHIKATPLTGTGKDLLLLTIQDLTVLKQSLEKAAESERVRKEIFERSLDAIIIMDERGDILDLNQSAETIFGFRRNDIAGRKLGECIVPHRMRKAHAEGMKRYITTGEGPVLGKRIEISALRSDGNEFPVELAICVGQSGGKPVFTSFIRDISERKKAEQALLASESKLRAVFDNTHEGILLIDPAAPGGPRMLEANPILRRMSEFSEQTIIEKFYSEFFTHDEIEGILAGKTRDSGDVSYFDSRVVRVGGKEYHFSSIVKGLYVNGNYCILLVFRDTTDVLTSLIEIEDTNREIISAQKTAKIVSWFYDSKTGSLEIKSTSEDNDLELDNEIKNEISQWIQKNLNKLSDLDADFEPVINHRVETPQKTSFFRSTISPVNPWQKGGPVSSQFVGATQDITKERQAEEAMKKFNRQLESTVQERTTEIDRKTREIQHILQSVPDTLLRLNRLGEVLYSQYPRGVEAKLDLLGPSSLGRERFIWPDILEKLDWTPGNNLTLVRETETLEKVYEIRLTVVSSDDCILVIRDISEQRRLEKEISEALRHERELSQMKSRFITTASHEFRTPMAAVSGSADLLFNHIDRIKPEKRNELIQRIIQGVERLKNIVEDVLTVSRADAGKIPVNIQEMALDGFLETLTLEFFAGYGKEYLLKVEKDPAIQMIWTDHRLIHHILSNLLNNAAKYSPKGSEIDLKIKQDDEWISFSVRDRGLGIPENEREHLFEPFFRASNVGTIQGTGLGLSIVKKYLEVLDGFIRLETNENGTLVSSYLPRQPFRGKHL